MAGKSHIGKYIGVFVALLGLTAVTVAVSKFHIPIFMVAVTIAMAVALTKGGLVMAFFMHLIGEQKIVYTALLITLIFFAMMMLIPVLTHLDNYNIVLN